MIVVRKSPDHDGGDESWQHSDYPVDAEDDAGEIWAYVNHAGKRTRRHGAVRRGGRREKEYGSDFVAARKSEPDDENGLPDVAHCCGHFAHVGPGHPVALEKIIPDGGEDDGKQHPAELRQAGQQPRHTDAPAMDVPEVGGRLRHKREQPPEASPLRHDVHPHGQRQEDTPPRRR